MIIEEVENKTNQIDMRHTNANTIKLIQLEWMAFSSIFERLLLPLSYF